MILKNLHQVSNDSDFYDLLSHVDLTCITTRELKSVYLTITDNQVSIPSKWNKQDILNALKRQLRACGRGAAFNGGGLSESTMIIDRLRQKV